MSAIASQPVSAASRGFGLIELLVAIGIIALITSTILVRQSSFNSTVILENQAWEVATDIRQTQNLAASPQQRAGDDWRGQYGITFTPGNRAYVIYHQSGDDTNTIASLSLDRRFSITQIRDADGGLIETGPVSIQFERPNFDPTFLVMGGSGTDPVTTSEIRVRIEPTGNNDDNRAREVRVTASGQVNVINPGL